MDVNMQNKKNSLIVSVLLAPIFYLKYALYGVKTICFDIWIYLFNIISWNTSLKFKNNSEMSTDELYERSKGRKKDQKIYRYSPSTMQKLEEKKKLLQEDLKGAGATRTAEPHTYFFKVRESNGKIITDSMQGMSKLDINSFLVNENYEVYDIETSKTKEFFFGNNLFGGAKLSTKDLIFWLTQLSTYIKAGLTLNSSVKILSTQLSSKKSQARAFQSMSYLLTLGESFSVAMEKQGKMFPPLLINMIKAAEASGTLEETLDDMIEYYTEIDETHKQMINAITYPIVILIFSIGVVTFIIMYVIPQFQGIYAESGAKVTGLTAMLINLSAYLSNNWLTIILLIFLIILAFIFLYKNIKAFKMTTQKILMHVPVIKNVIIYNELTIFSKTFASLLRNNVFITESMDILSEITKNEIYKAIIYKTMNNIVKGDKISEAFRDHWAIPDIAYYMIVTGESTGQLATMMQKVSEYYQSQHKAIVNNLKTFIEPILIAFLAIIVGLIIIAVIVPMFEIYNTIQ